MVVTLDTVFCEALETFGSKRLHNMCHEKLCCKSMVMDIPVSEGVQKTHSQILCPRNEQLCACIHCNCTHNDDRSFDH